MSAVFALTRSGNYCTAKLTVQPSRTKSLLCMISGNSTFNLNVYTPMHYMLPLYNSSEGVIFVHVFTKGDMILIYVPESTINSCAKSAAFVNDLGVSFSSTSTNSLNFIFNTDEHTMEYVHNTTDFHFAANVKDFTHLFGLMN